MQSMTRAERAATLAELKRDRCEWTRLLNTLTDESYRAQVMKRLDHIESVIRAINPEF